MTYNFDPIATRESFDRLRAKGVAVANEQSAAVRHVLSGLRLALLTETTATAMAIAAMGNPKTPKGKAIDKLGGLNDRNVQGGDAVRKALKASFNAMNYSTIPVQTEDGQTIAAPIPAVLAVIDSFIDNEKSAPKGIHALETACKALWQEAMGDAAKDAPSEGDGDGDAPSDAPSDAPASLSEEVEAMAKMLADAPTSDLEGAQSALASLADAIAAASDRIASKAQRDAA